LTRGSLLPRTTTDSLALRRQRRSVAFDGDHRRAAGVAGVDDLRAVDALEIDRGDPEVPVRELALDDDQWTPSRAISTACA
jgi:hypothetical protein